MLFFMFVFALVPFFVFVFVPGQEFLSAWLSLSKSTVPPGSPPLLLAPPPLLYFTRSHDKKNRVPLSFLNAAQWTEVLLGVHLVAV